MIKFFFVIQIFIVWVLFIQVANSSTPSSYLIANTAILLKDYDTAAKYYSKNLISNNNLCCNLTDSYLHGIHKQVSILY